MRFFLIILFCIVFSELITSSFEPILQIIFKIPDSKMFLAFWGETYWTRIVSSLLGTLAGGYIIGSHISKKITIATILYSLPIVLFWGFNLFIYYRLYLLPTNSVPEFSLLSRWHIVPLILTLLSFPVAYVGSFFGGEVKSKYSESRGVLNINWFHWLWLFPFVISQVISVVVFLILAFIYEERIGGNFFNNLFPYANVFFSLFGGLGILYTVFNLFSLLSTNITIEGEKTKYKWLKIIGAVILLNFLYGYIFGVSKFYMFSN